MDDPLDLVVAIVWWLAVAAVVGGIVWAEGKRREKMRLAFIGEGVVYNPEAGLVMPDAGESELAALERTLSGMAFPDEVAALDERVRPSFCVWSRRAPSPRATAALPSARPCFPHLPYPRQLRGACLRSAMGAPLRLRRGRGGERIGTFPRHFRGCDLIGFFN